MKENNIIYRLVKGIRLNRIKPLVKLPSFRKYRAQRSILNYATGMQSVPFRLWETLQVKFHRQMVRKRKETYRLKSLETHINILNTGQCYGIMGCPMSDKAMTMQ